MGLKAKQKVRKGNELAPRQDQAAVVVKAQLARRAARGRVLQHLVQKAVVTSFPGQPARCR